MNEMKKHAIENIQYYTDQGEEDRNFKIIQLEENKEKKDYIIYEIPSKESELLGFQKKKRGKGSRKFI